MLQVLLFVILALFAAVLMIYLLIGGARMLLRLVRNAGAAAAPIRLRTPALLFAAALAAVALLILISQWTASTPPIRDAQGNPVPGSIAELAQVELNGRKEWISIRGHSADRPVLLFLAGGPGGSQMAATRYSLSALEAHFTVISWDQPGSGKSYGALARRQLTPEVYVEDGLALTEYLLDRFGQERITLVGESWGSALAILLAAARPDLYHAVIGTGQMVAFEETERIDYALALSLAEEAGNADLVRTLTKNGPPPYYGNDVTWKSAAYLNYLSGIMARNPAVQNGGFNTMRDLGASEYGLEDKLHYLLGIANTFGHVYPQLYGVDLRQTHHTLQVPVYLFLGRHDINAPLSLAEEYFDLLQAPEKEIVWFEHSAHSPWINESARFVAETLRVTGLSEQSISPD